MTEFFTGVLYVIIYYAALATVALTLRVLTKIPDEPFRKLLHLILLNSLPVFLFAFREWWHATLFCVIFAVVVYPVLMLFERHKDYSHTVTERKKGELKSSLLVVFSMFAIVISVSWGLLSDKWLALASVYAWGVGDAAAALIGKRFGKHKIGKSKKSYEGSFAMLVCSISFVLIFLLCRGGMEWYGYLLTSLIAGLACTAVEFYTPGGFDTITCPISAMAVILPLVYLVF